MTLFFQTSFGRSMQWLQVIKERYFITILAVLREKIFWEHWQFFWNLLHTQDTNFLKNDYLLFERYRPEINPRLHKWCCEQISRRFRSFWGKKNFSKVASFFFFFCISGVTYFLKMTNFFFERYGPEIFRGLHKWCCERILRRFRSFRAKKIFSKVASFLTFFAYPGSQISWKMTNFFFERYRPEICRGLHKWCCERILRCFRSFRAKKIFQGCQFFDFFCISGVTDFLKND